MDNKVQGAIQLSLKNFNKVTGSSVTEFESQIQRVFDSEEPFMQKVSMLDEAFDNASALDILREVYFDLLMVNFFSEDIKKLEEDYLDTEEWEAIEEETIDRGTELLNLFLYLKECDDEDIEPELEDYLKEFLLVDEDEFQDEHRIYEDVIANQILVDSSFDEIAKATDNLDPESEIKELFFPMMSFFLENNPSDSAMEEYIKFSSDPEFDAPVYAMLIGYNQN